MHQCNSECYINVCSSRIVIDLSTALMAPMYQSRYTEPDSIKTNPQSARLLVSLFNKVIVKEGNEARKWHQHPIYSKKFSGVAPEKFHKRFDQLHAEKFGNSNECKFYKSFFKIFISNNYQYPKKLCVVNRKRPSAFYRTAKMKSEVMLVTEVSIKKMMLGLKKRMKYHFIRHRLLSNQCTP